MAAGCRDLKLPNHSPSMTVHRTFSLYAFDERKRGKNVLMSSIKILRNLHSLTSFFCWVLEQKIRRNFSFNWELFDSTVSRKLRINFLICKWVIFVIHSEMYAMLTNHATTIYSYLTRTEEFFVKKKMQEINVIELLIKFYVILT